MEENKEKDINEINNKYFTNDFSKEIWETTYKLKSEQTIEETWRRVAKAVASVEETPELQSKWEQEFYRILENFKLVPGGRILANAGTSWSATLVNCFVGNKDEFDADSLDGIMNVLKRQALTLASEGGYGLNFSFIRPRGTFVKGRGIRTPGAVKYMELFDKSSEIITEGPGDYDLAYEKLEGKPEAEKKKIRKGAQIFLLSCSHPDVIEFIQAKRVPGRLTKANLSVQVTDKFMQIISTIEELKMANPKDPQIEKLDKWDLVFPDTDDEHYQNEWDGNLDGWIEKGYKVKIYKTIKATELWDLIMESTYKWNDPGVLFTDIANRTNCANYIGKEQFIDASNPCGEITMGPSSACLLSSWNLTQYVNFNKETGTYEFDYTSFAEDIPVGLRFMDNVASLTKLPLDVYEQMMRDYRRLGMGFMGLGSTLLLLGLKYGSESSLEFIHKILNIMNCEALSASIILGAERGSYKNCDYRKHLWNVLQTFPNLSPSQKLQIETLAEQHKAFRNVALFTVPPTGNTGCLANNVSGGVEPLFALETIRVVNVPEIPKTLKNKVPKFWEGSMEPNQWFKLHNEWGVNYLKYTDPVSNITYKIIKDRGLCKEVILKDYAVNLLGDSVDTSQVATKLSVDQHLSVLQAVAEHLDQNASKTVNLPEDYSYEEFKNLYLFAWRGGRIKGLTTFRENTKMAVLTAADKSQSACDCCCGEARTINKTMAPKRPKTLPCKVHLMTIKGIAYYAIVSMLGDDPYEVFIGQNKEDIKNEDGEYVGSKLLFYQKLNGCEGELTRLARGKYVFKPKDGKIEVPITRTEENEDAALIAAFSRILSWGLRHGGDIRFAVEQLEKTEGSFSSATKVFSRVLKKYIKQDCDCSSSAAKVKHICPKCGAALVFSEGCKHCAQCGWSACG